MRRSCLHLLVLAALAAGAACGSDNTTPTPTTPTPQSSTETFEGSLTKNGAVSHSFIVTTTLASDVTLTASTLDPVVTVGLALGTWNGVACQVIIANDAATMGTTVIGKATGAGSLCARIYDAAGSLTDPVSYKLTVVHY